MKTNNQIYVLQKPYVGDDGIYIPCEPYAPVDCATTYECILSRDLFVEAYNKWIKGEVE
jgi:hypothetical protein